MIPLSSPYLLAVVAVAGVLAGSFGGWTARGVVADRAIAELQVAQAQERQRSADAARAAEAQAREVEQDRVKKLEAIENEARTRTASLAADAAAARRAADSLRQHIARLAAGGQTASDPAPAVSGPPAAGPGLVLAELLIRSVDRTVELAAAYDAANAAGLACERAYDAVRGDP
jgi:hypothetical protein